MSKLNAIDLNKFSKGMSDDKKSLFKEIVNREYNGVDKFGNTKEEKVENFNMIYEKAVEMSRIKYGLDYDFDEIEYYMKDYAYHKVSSLEKYAKYSNKFSENVRFNKAEKFERVHRFDGFIKEYGDEKVFKSKKNSLTLRQYFNQFKKGDITYEQFVKYVEHFKVANPNRYGDSGDNKKSQYFNR